MKAIVIGGVAAGMSAASKLRRVKPDAQIVVYERGGFLSYGACGLPYYVGGFNDDPAKLIARTQAVYKEMRIETHLFHEVTRVDPERKTVTVRNLDTGAVFEDAYDMLMVATGCNSVNPKIPGADSPAVFYLKTMEDGLLLHEILRLRDVTRVAVVGGGYIGLEMAEALLHLGKDVTLIEAGPRLLASFEPEFSELAAQELEKNGVRVRVGCRVQEIADAGSERSGKRTKHDAAQQNEAVSRMNVAEGRCRDLDDHGRHACHGGEEGSSYQFFDILICHRKSPFLSDSYKSLYFNVDA